MFQIKTLIGSFCKPNVIRYMENCRIEKKSFLQKYYRVKLKKRYGIFVGNNVQIGKNLNLPHPNGIVIGSNVKIGDNVRIYQQVTIGGHNIGDSQNGRMPEIGNDVVLFAGAKILGNVKIADGTIIGANAVVLHDTEKNGIYAGVPAILKKWRQVDDNKTEH